jgi:exopolyphosphatase/guanosine-5'-triphosphate,3'-diphosphate pyrophosphatase
MRVAVVDIGTNSTRLLIAEVEDGTVTAELVRRSVVTRLGAGVDADGRLSDEATERVYSTLQEYAALIERERPDRSVAVLTSAVRDAANGREFAATVEQRFQLEPHILSGDEEAGLTFLGAMSERDPDDPTATVVVDIGGGSTELVIGHGREASFHVSTQAGVVRQTERHLHTDPPTREELGRLIDDVRSIISEATPRDQRDAVSRAIAVAGTATSLASIAQRLDPYDPQKVHGYVLGIEECRRLLSELAALPLERRRQITGLDPARAPTIVAGVAILIEVLGLFGLDRVEVSEHDILRGAALGLTGSG